MATSGVSEIDSVFHGFPDAIITQERLCLNLRVDFLTGENTLTIQ